MEGLLLGSEERLYADAAYIGPTTRALLAAGRGGKGTEDHVQGRNSHSRKLTPDGVARNEGTGVIRAGVGRSVQIWTVYNPVGFQGVGFGILTKW